MFVDELLRLVAVVRSSSERPGFWARLGTATWGSVVLHGAMWIQEQRGLDLSIADFEPAIVLVLVLTYSIVFGLIVAAGIPKGSLIRHFAMGVFLPTLAYSLAAVIMGD